VTFQLGRGLLLSGAVSSEELAEALYAVATQGIPLARALVGLGAIDEMRLEEELARTDPIALTHVDPLPKLMERLPPGLCHRLAALPIAVDGATGAVELAVLDPRDPHAADEVGYHLETSVRARRASYAALREAFERYPGGLRALAAPLGSAFDSRRHVRGSAAAWSTLERAPEDKGLLPRLPDGAFLLRRKSMDSSSPGGDEASIKTRIYGSTLGAAEATWDAEPVFELRRPGPPPTVSDPEPVTTRLASEEVSIRLSPSRAPIAPEAPPLPYPDLGSTLAGIRAGSDRDGVLGLVQLGARSVARRVALFVVRKDGLAGWSCTPEFGEEAALRALKVPLVPPHPLLPLLSGSVYLGPLPELLAAPLLGVMRTFPQEVAIVALRVADRAAMLLVADELGDTLLATKRLEDLAHAAGEALLRIVRTART
jgi:hypothetical protein